MEKERDIPPSKHLGEETCFRSHYKSVSGDTAENILMAGDSLARTRIGRSDDDMAAVEPRTDEWGDLGTNWPC